MNDLKVGDVVTLKSGGLPMTITCVVKDEISRLVDCSCKWFDNVGHIQLDHFKSDILKEYYR